MDPYTKCNIDSIEMVQRRAARYVTNRYHNTSSITNMISIQGWRSLAHRRVDARLCLMFKIVNELVAIPLQNYLMPFARSSRLHHSQAFQIPNSKADYHLCSFFPTPSVFGILFRSSQQHHPTWSPLNQESRPSTTPVKHYSFLSLIQHKHVLHCVKRKKIYI